MKTKYHDAAFLWRDVYNYMLKADRKNNTNIFSNIQSEQMYKMQHK